MFCLCIHFFLANGEVNTTIDIFDVYKIDSGSKIVEVEYYGKWNESRSTEIEVVNPIMWKRRGDMKGYHIRY